MSVFSNLGNKKIVIGLVHLKPLPGTPYYEEGGFEESMEKALADVQALSGGGADGCLIQTVDRVYPAGDEADYARVAAISLITHEVKKAVGADFIIGVQLMWNGITPSLAVAKVCGAAFTRCTALIGTTASPFGLVEANPHKVQQYRRQIGAQDVAMIAEIEGYHAKWLGGEVPLTYKVQMAKMAGADAVEVMHADEEANNRMVYDIKKAFPSMPVVLGGKTNLENVSRRMKNADAVLVGSCFENKHWGGSIDQSIVKEYVSIVRSLEK